jgi:hypothetical protein
MAKKKPPLAHSTPPTTYSKYNCTKKKIEITKHENKPQKNKHINYQEINSS